MVYGQLYILTEPVGWLGLEYDHLSGRKYPEC